MVKPQPIAAAANVKIVDNRVRFPGVTLGYVDVKLWNAFIRCPYGTTGDVLWVREPIRRHNDNVQYVADDVVVREPWPPGKRNYRLARWMPRSVCRFELTIVDVRIERLQDITDDDAKAEGVEPAPYKPNTIWIANPENSRRHIRSYAAAWDSLDGSHGMYWRDNPWVWVVTFKRREK